MGAEEALDVLDHARRAQRHAEVQAALAMLHVASTYRAEITRDKVQLGRDGTPLVDDFCCLELAAALGRSVESVTGEVIGLLDLQYRHPRTWLAVRDCRMPLWLARKITDTTRSLGLGQALWVDATLAPFLTRLPATRLLRFAAGLAVQADPQAADHQWHSPSDRYVWIGDIRGDGLRDLGGRLTAADACYLDAALEQLSAILATHGSPQDPQERRAAALGILATPARALAMIQCAVQQPSLIQTQAGTRHHTGQNHPSDPDPANRAEPDSAEPDPAEPDPADPADADPADLHAAPGPRSPHGCAGHTCGTITVNPDRLLPKTTLIVHISDHTLLTRQGVGRCEQLGALTTNQIRQVLADSRVTVRPVVDPNGIIPVDHYEIPEHIRRAVLLRHPIEVFPYAVRRGDHLDLDHTNPYRWDGTAGQTTPDNLGPLRRKTHRAKTHAGWRLTQPEPGRFEWTSPLKRRYTVTPAGLTIRHHDPWQTHAPDDEPFNGAALPAPPRRESGSALT